jgi:hypothetical protein
MAARPIKRQPPSAGLRRSPDAWLMEITDSDRGEHKGSGRAYLDAFTN